MTFLLKHVINHLSAVTILMYIIGAAMFFLATAYCASQKSCYDSSLILPCYESLLSKASVTESGIGNQFGLSGVALNTSNNYTGKVYPPVN